jgi:chromosome segregation ATPase
MAESKSKRVVVGFILEGTDKARQDFNEIRKSAADFGTEGVKAAQELVESFESIERGVDKVTKKIEDGKTVSDRDLTAMKQSYTLLGEQIEKTFGSLDKAPVKIQEAFKKAETQIGVVGSAIRKVEDQVESAGQKFEELADKVDQVPPALARAEDMVGRFHNKLQAESDVSMGDLENIWRSQIQLNDAIKRGEINIKDLGEEGKKRLNDVRRAAEDAEKEFVRLERATEVQAAKMKTGSGDVAAAGTAMFGTFSKVAGIVGIVIGLVVQFKDKLVDVANWLGLRGDKVQAWLDGFSARFQLALRAGFDTLKNLLEAGGTILDGIVSKRKDLIVQGLADLQNASQQTLSTFTTAFAGTNEQVEALAKQLGITTAAAERGKDALEGAADAAKRAAEEAKRLAEEKKKLAKQIDDVTASLKQETAELEHQQAVASSSEMKAFDSSSQLQSAEGKVRQLEQAVSDLQTKLQQSIQDWGADSAAAKNAAAELEQYQTMLARARERAEELTESTAKYREEQEKATEAAKDAEKNVGELKNRQGELTKELEKLTGATEKSAHGWTYAESQVVLYRDAQGHLEIGQRAVKVATEEATKAIEDAAKKDKDAATAKDENAAATERAAAAVKVMADKVNAVDFSGLIGKLEAIDKIMDSIVLKSEKVSAAIEKMTNAGGAEEASKIDIRRTGSSSSLGKGDKLGGGFKGAQL